MSQSPDEPSEMLTWQQFVDQERQRLAAFETWWNDQSQQNPEYFPDRLPAGEWWEQFHFFVEGEMGDDEHVS